MERKLEGLNHLGQAWGGSRAAVIHVQINGWDPARLIIDASLSDIGPSSSKEGPRAMVSANRRVCAVDRVPEGGQSVRAQFGTPHPPEPPQSYGTVSEQLYPRNRRLN